MVDAVIGVCFFAAALGGVGIGLALAFTRNAETLELMGEEQPALPSEVLDRNGDLITTFFSTENRQLVSLSEVPQHLIDALLTREDRNFFRHKGWDPIGLIKALAGHFLLGRPLRGASTITQQLAGWLYDDRTDISLGRKVRELWWAFQMERRWTKQEILEKYLNEMPLGHNNSGVEAASQFYFGHSVRNISLAESALLVIVYANPTLYSPLKNPEGARERSHEILQDMVKLGYATQAEADRSFNEYWDNYAWNRSATSSAFFNREDKAPYFSEYVRGLLDEMLFGAWDMYTDGLRIYTTLDLGYQAVADRVMTKHIGLVSGMVERTHQRSDVLARDEFLPLVEMLALGFEMPDFVAGSARRQNDAYELYLERLNPQLDTIATMFGLTELKEATLKGQELRVAQMRQTELEGALVSLDSTRGWILAMVGGRKFESTNQFNRAVLGRVQPGSSFKPLYYSAAIDSRKATMATMLVDAPTSFVSPDGTYWQPLNFIGSWEGPVLLWWALADSKNVPSAKVFDMVGIENAIDWTSRLLALDTPAAREAAFKPPHGYPIALGVAAVSPLQMARAYATFPNGGEAVEPVAILKIVDRNGRVILEPEKEARLKRGASTQLVSPQTARIMTEILQRAVQRGTLNGTRYLAQQRGADIADDWDRPIAGKTGTTQNWVAAWTVGFTPQVTTAIWMGFDQGVRSMGRRVTGATAVAPAWVEYMDTIHRGLPVMQFKEPARGLVRQTVCAVSGQLPTEYCTDGLEVLTFIEGTAPRTLCDIHVYAEEQTQSVIQQLNPFLDFRSELPPDMLRSFLDDAADGGDGGRSPLAD